MIDGWMDLFSVKCFECNISPNSIEHKVLYHGLEDVVLLVSNFGNFKKLLRTFRVKGPFFVLFAVFLVI